MHLPKRLLRRRKRTSVSKRQQAELGMLRKQVNHCYEY